MWYHGLIYGLILYKREGELTKKELLIRLIISTVLVTIFVNMGLNTIWLMIMYKKAFIVLLSTRVLKEIIMIPIQIATVFLVAEGLKPILKKYLI